MSAIDAFLGRYVRVPVLARLRVGEPEDVGSAFPASRPINLMYWTRDPATATYRHIDPYIPTQTDFAVAFDVVAGLSLSDAARLLGYFESEARAARRRDLEWR